MVGLSFIQNIANTTHLISESQIIDMIAISEITPGPLLVNMATYIGYIIKGIPGSILTTFALILPQTIIVFYIFKIFAKFKDNKNLEIVLKGIRPVSLALSAGATFTIFRKVFINTDIEIHRFLDYFNILNYKYVILGIIVLIAMMKYKKIPTIVFFIVCGVIGIFL